MSVTLEVVLSSISRGAIDVLFAAKCEAALFCLSSNFSPVDSLEEGTRETAKTSFGLMEQH